MVGGVVKSELYLSRSPLQSWCEPSGRTLPAVLAPWLLESGSLTQRLRDHGEGFALELLGYHDVMLAEDEARWLGERQARCREVVLSLAGTACVYGWTLVPQRGMRCAALAGQGQTPLGELVFTSGAVQRRELQVATFAVEQSRWCRAAIVWGRRSLLEWQGIPLLVHELFLPGLVDDKESM